MLLFQETAEGISGFTCLPWVLGIFLTSPRGNGVYLWRLSVLPLKYWYNIRKHLNSSYPQCPVPIPSSIFSNGSQDVSKTAVEREQKDLVIIHKQTYRILGINVRSPAGLLV